MSCSYSALQICQTYPNILESYQNQLILGVMGVDVSLEDIKKLTPRFTVSCLCWCFFFYAQLMYSFFACSFISHTAMTGCELKYHQASFHIFFSIVVDFLTVFSPAVSVLLYELSISMHP